MSILNKWKSVLLLLSIFAFAACETDFVNPNAPTDAQILNSKDGLINLAAGVRQVYSTGGLRWLVETPAITTREGGITTTFINMIELEEGGGRDAASPLPNFNSNVEGLWATMLRVNAMAQDIIDNAAVVELEAGTEAGLIAWGHLFKAMSIGALVQNYEQVITDTSPGNDAKFVSREDALAQAITLLEQARDLLAGTPASAEFLAVVGGIDLVNTINAYLARYQLFAGNYDAAISAASAVDQSVLSTFSYDILNPNPIWGRVIQNGEANFKPRDNFGLPTDEFSFDANDGRLSFYLVSLDETNQNGLPIEDLAGFFTTDATPIPAYLPDEMNLIIAEANVRKSSPDLGAAIDALNAVLTDTDDVSGVNASVAPYGGEETAEAILLEIYRNRRAELFLTGMSLEDSRRFGRPEPSVAPMQFEEERNRNFYPYPLRERSNNPNTPDDPVI
jgi:hypothetical protein